AITPPPPAGTDQLAVECAMCPAVGISSTRTNSTHSTCPTTAHLTARQRFTFQLKMKAVAVPPFERFYLQHRDEVLGYLRRLLGQRAEDAWQETFLRALRAYDRLEHGRHLRAWVFTIATRVAMDELRTKARDESSLDANGAPDPAAPETTQPAYRELEPLTDR